jgi:hypothetical protein
MRCGRGVELRALVLGRRRLGGLGELLGLALALVKMSKDILLGDSTTGTGAFDLVGIEVVLLDEPSNRRTEIISLRYPSPLR